MSLLLSPVITPIFPPSGLDGSACAVRTAGLLGLDARHDKAKSIRQALCLLGRLCEGFLQRLGGRRQTTLLSFCSLCHVAVSVTMSWLASFAATVRAWGDVELSNKVHSSAKGT